MSQVWTTPQSPLRIEYSAELLLQVQREGSGEGRGVLYGRRYGTQVRLLAARRAGYARDPRLVGLEQVGVFAVRLRGNVFLTEQDLEFAQRNGVGVTLVLAGRRGGFFVPEKDGSTLAIRSHQEFSVPDAVPVAKNRVNHSSVHTAEVNAALNGMGMAVCLVLAVAAALYAEPKAALTLAVHEEAGALVAVWSPGVLGTLEIRDSERKIQVPVSVPETRTTYQPDSGDVEFVLTSLDGTTRQEHINTVNSARKPLLQLVVKRLGQLHAELKKMLPR